MLATKLANPAGPGPNDRGLSRKWIMAEAQRSLKRLQTDFIDILYLHKEDNQTPLEETVRAIADLQRAGAIRYFGVSNFKAWRIARICAICDAEGIDRPVVCQPLYHALNRTIEVEVLPACAALGIGVAVYSPTARGVLSGKYAKDAPPPGGKPRRRAEPAHGADASTSPRRSMRRQRIAAHARARGVEPAAFATAWVLANPIVTGRDRRPAHDGAVAELPEGDRRRLDGRGRGRGRQLVPAGTTAVHQFIDPSYPVEGRPTRRAATAWRPSMITMRELSAGRAATTSPRSPPLRRRRCTRRSASAARCRSPSSRSIRACASAARR